MVRGERLKQSFVALLDTLPLGLVNKLISTLPRKSNSHALPRCLCGYPGPSGQDDVLWKEVYPLIESRYQPPQVLLRDKSLNTVFTNVQWSAVGVYEIHLGRVVSRHGLAYSQNRTMLADATINFELKSAALLMDLIRDRTPKQTSWLKGRTLNLASAWACINYGHTILDSVSRLHLVEKAGYKIRDFEQIILPKFTTPAIERLLRSAEISSSNVVYTERGSEFECEVLVQPSHPCSNRMRNYPHWVPTYLKSLLNLPYSSGKRRLYIPRGLNKRGIREETDLLKVLREYGFEVVDPKHQPNCIDLFAEAEMVVGAHGAGLADISFCQPGTVIIELLPKDWLYPYYYSLASACGMSYFAMLGSRIGSDGAFSINTSEFRELFTVAEKHASHRGSQE